MFSYPKTIIFRHRRENLKKCSLKGLENRHDMQFFTYPKDHFFDVNNYVLLTLDGKEISEEDENMGIFLIDGTWKYAQKMLNNLPESVLKNKRSIPKIIKTAYPRRQTLCPSPEEGLSSIEALYIAYLITKKDPANMLDHYYWKNDFIKKNKSFLNLYGIR